LFAGKKAVVEQYVGREDGSGPEATVGEESKILFPSLEASLIKVDLVEFEEENL